VLHIDENSSIRLLANTLTYPRVELLSGTAVVELDGGKRYAVEVFLGQTAVKLSHIGIYRFESEPPRLKVYEGAVAVDHRGKIATGHALALTSGRVTRFDRNEKDALEWWRERRIRRLARDSGFTAQQDLEREGSGHFYPPDRGRICPAP
jgi:ferric-dicitrate binding protein FerR (iron transport regulator)